MRKIGYARASAQHQNLDRQLGALVAAACAGRPAKRRGCKSLTMKE